MTAAIVPSAIGEAEAILREVDATPWPQTREAKAVIGYVRGYLTEVMDIHARILDGCADGDLDASAGQVHDAALALRNRLAEYRRREAAQRRAA